MPPIGNYFTAEKIGAGDVEKFIGCLDFPNFYLDFFLLSAVGQYLLRGKIRKRDNISGSSGGDCFAAFCCLGCSICQTMNHLGID